MANPVDQRGETIRVGAIMGIPPVAPVAHEPGDLEHAEMFGNGGLRNPGLVSERAHGQLAVAAQPFEDGAASWVGNRVVKATAERGEKVLRELLDTDAGAARLGEVALVPHNSPVAQSGLLFYNTLFDENAASHVALGSAYKFTIAGGEGMTDEQFEEAGGNRSVTHVDFMIGSPDLDIDGVLADGSVEPLMRSGNWAQALGS